MDEDVVDSIRCAKCQLTYAFCEDGIVFDEKQP
jgi:hypothetical protein